MPQIETTLHTGDIRTDLRSGAIQGELRGGHITTVVSVPPPAAGDFRVTDAGDSRTYND
jgi:hypothetical protein